MLRGWHNPVGVEGFVTISQGSSFLATLGWKDTIPLGLAVQFHSPKLSYYAIRMVNPPSIITVSPVM